MLRARKNGKTGLLGVAALWHLMHVPRWSGLAISIKSLQAGILRDAIEATAEVSGLLDDIHVTRSPSPGKITGPHGSALTFLSSEKAGGHGGSADLALFDETGLFHDNSDPLLTSVEAAIAARNGRVVHISILGHSRYFRELRERSGRDPSVVWHHYAADEDAPLDAEETWRAANPGLGTVKALEYMRDTARAAMLTPSRRPAFRVMDLNLPGRGEVRDMLVEAEAWAACERSELPARSGPVVLGLDFGGATSLTAAVPYWPRTGRVEALAAVGGIPDLARRGEVDGVGGLYVRAAEAGDLIEYPGRKVVPVDEFLRAVRERFDLRGRIRVAADRYREAEVHDALRSARLPWVVSFRQRNWKDGTRAVRALQAAVLERRLAHDGRNELFEHSLANAVLKPDDAGNVRIDKAARLSRIDLADALTLAAAEGEPLRKRPRRRAVRVASAGGRRRSRPRETDELGRWTIRAPGS